METKNNEMKLPMEICKSCKLYKEFIKKNESVFCKSCKSKSGKNLDCELFELDCLSLEHLFE